MGDTNTGVPAWMARTNMLLGEEKINRLINARVLMVGLGGVGGICAEMIARSGVGTMTIVDADVVEASNINRQLPALHTTIGQLKVEVMAERIRAVNPDIKLNVKPIYIDETNIEALLEEMPYDYVVDCIDTLQPKVLLMKTAKEKGLQIVSAFGAGGRQDPSQIKVVDIKHTHNCNLAYYVRKALHKHGIYTGIKTVWTPEPIEKERVVEVDGRNKKSAIGTVSYMPAILGCTVASVVIRDLSGGDA